MKVYKSSVFLMSLILLLACSKSKEKVVKDDSDVKFRLFNLEKMGWKSKSYTHHVDNIAYKATEVPIQYYLLKDRGDADLLKIDSLYEQNKTERVVEFIFQDEEERDLLDEKFTEKNYKDAVTYMSFKIQDDFTVVTSKKDTIKCAGSLFERNFKVAPYQKVLLFFSGIDPDEKIQLIYNDRLFRKGTFKFTFREPILNL